MTLRTLGTSAAGISTTLATTYGHKGDGVARFITRARAGENLTVAILGDSIGSGYLLSSDTTQRFTALVCADLHTRFGGTISEANFAEVVAAVPSYTAFRSFIGLKVESVVNAAPDLVIIEAFDKNDIGADQFGQYAPGYQLAQSTAAIERMIRIIRANVPKADIMLMSTNPYIGTLVSGNAYQQTKDAAVRRLATTYGCEWVDGYAAFTALGTFASYMTDETHPNAAGHRVLADAILDHIPNAERIARTAAASPTKGLYNPEQVDTDVALTTGSASYGYMGAAGAGSRYNGEFVWTNVGTWTTDGAGTDTTTTAGDYAEFVFYGTELTAQIDTSNAAAAVLTVTIDGSAVATNQAMNLGKNNGLNFVTVAQGLTAAVHTVRLTLVTGTLSINVAYALAGPHSAAASISTLMSDTGTVSLDTAGAWTTVKSASLALPTGWTKALVILQGSVGLQITATTTTDRRMQADLLVAGASILPLQPAIIQQSATAIREETVPLASSYVLTGTVTVDMKARVISTDKTNCRATSMGMRATFIKMG